MDTKGKILILSVFILLNTLSISAQRIMITPNYLKKGDTAAILATARKIDASSLKPAVRLLESWGLNVVFGNTIGLEENQLAGPDRKRAEDFQQMLDDPSVKAIWAAKGGYGTVRIIDAIDFSRFRQKPKWIIGFSDITVLHSHINNMNIQTLHGIMAASVGSASPQAVESLRKSLFGENVSYQVPATKTNREGVAEGELVGGNLSVIYSILGTGSQVDMNNKILFIEDLDEYLYHVDRMMMNLKRSGFFDNLKGLIVGGMTSMNDNEVPWGKTAEEIIQDIVRDYDFPVVYNFPAGHLKDNRALPLGKVAKLVVAKEQVTLSFNED